MKMHMSALFARALILEVTENPRTMNPITMAEHYKSKIATNVVISLTLSSKNECQSWLED